MMTNFEEIMKRMSVAEYAQLKSDANACPSSRTLSDCADHKRRHERSVACFFCWVHWLKEEYVE